MLVSFLDKKIHLKHKNHLLLDVQVVQAEAEAEAGAGAGAGLSKDLADAENGLTPMTEEAQETKSE